MKIFEKLLIIVLVGLLVLNKYVEKTDNITAIYAVFFCMTYFFFGIKLLTGKRIDTWYNETLRNKKQTKKFILFILYNFVIPFSLVAISFKILEWPGYMLYLKVNIVLLLLLFVFSTVLYLVNKEKIFLAILIRVIIFISILFYLYP